MGTYKISSTIVNATLLPLSLVTASRPYGSWEDRPQDPLKGGASEPVSVNSSNIEGVILYLVYAAPDGTQFTMNSYVPAGWANNSYDAYITGPNANLYRIDGSISSGFHASSVFHVWQVTAESNVIPESPEEDEQA